MLIENSGPVTLLERKAERLAYLLEAPLLEDDSDGVDDFSSPGDMVKKKSIFSHGKEVKGAEQFIHSVPPIWRQAYFEIHRSMGEHGQEREEMLERLDYLSTKLELQGDDLDPLDKLALMERDRAFGMKDTLHLADLEPGAREKYV